MRVIKKINSVNVCTLGNKGVGLLCAVLDSLTKKNRKKQCKLFGSSKYLYTLSLSL